MLENLTKLGIDTSLKSISSKKMLEFMNLDFKCLHLKKYLKKYYSEISPYDREVWDKAMNKLVLASCDKNRHFEMSNNFGYVSLDKHDFKKQNKVYNKLKEDMRFEEDLRKFIGFMAGTHFFDRYSISLEEWLTSNYWTKPYAKGKYPEMQDKYTISEVLNYKYGQNYLRCILPKLSHWERY